MRQSVPFRSAAALSFHFSVLCAFPVLDGNAGVMAASLALAFLWTCVYTRLPNPAVRIIAVFFPALPLLKARSAAALAAIGAAVVWFFFLAVLDRLETEHWQYVGFFGSWPLPI